MPKARNRRLCRSLTSPGACLRRGERGKIFNACHNCSEDSRLPVRYALDGIPAVRHRRVFARPGGRKHSTRARLPKGLAYKTPGFSTGRHPRGVNGRAWRSVHVREPAPKTGFVGGGEPSACRPAQVTDTPQYLGGMPMALRHVRPLSHEDRVAFLEDLERGPTPEQTKAVRDATEKAKHLTAPCEYCRCLKATVFRQIKSGTGKCGLAMRMQTLLQTRFRRIL